MNILSILGSLIPLIILALLVYGIVALVRRRPRQAHEEPEAVPGMNTLKRLYFYAMALAGFLAAMVAARNILAALFDQALATDVLVNRNPAETYSLNVALLVVGAPIWWLHWRYVAQTKRRYPAEARSVVRKLYVYVVLGASAITGLLASIFVLRWLLGGVHRRDLDGGSIASLLVWGLVWVAHYRLDRSEGQPSEGARTVRRWYQYALSLYTLYQSSVALGLVLASLLLAAYDRIAPSVLLVSPPLWNVHLQTWSATAALSLAWWGWHWFFLARNDTSSELRQVYLHLFGVFAGQVTALASIAFIAFNSINYAFSETRGAGLSAWAEFRFLPAAVSSLFLGLGLLLYHRAVLQREAPSMEEHKEPRRASRYLLSFLALGAVVGAIVVAVALLISAFASSSRQVLVSGNWWQGGVSLLLTLSLVGVPVWGAQWGLLQAEARAAEDRETPSRRAYLYAVLAAAVLSLLGSLTFVLYSALREIVQSTQGLADMKWGVGVVAAAVAAGLYHWRVLQADQRAAGPPAQAPAPPKVVTLLVSREAAELAARLESALGRRPEVLWHASPMPSPVLTEAEVQALAERVKASPTQRVMVVQTADGVSVYPYDS